MFKLIDELDKLSPNECMKMFFIITTHIPHIDNQTINELKCIENQNISRLMK